MALSASPWNDTEGWRQPERGRQQHGGGGGGGGSAAVLWLSRRWHAVAGASLLGSRASDKAWQPHDAYVGRQRAMALPQTSNPSPEGPAARLTSARLERRTMERTKPESASVVYVPV